MGDLIPDVDLTAEVVSSCNLCLYRPVCKKAFFRYEQHTVDNNDTYSDSENGDLTVQQQQQQYRPNFPPERSLGGPDVRTLAPTNQEGLTVQELGIALSGILDIQDSNETVEHNLASKEVQPLYVDTCISENWTKSHTIVNEGSLTTAVHISSLLKVEDSTDACMIDLLSTPKLVSAMKGSHAKQGLPVKSELRVTWASDVYDPPVTSDSHTVKGYRQLFKYKKDQNKHKHSKSKSLRGSSGEKKHAHGRNMRILIDPRVLRLRTLNSPVLSSGVGRSKVEVVVVDYTIRRHETKIGSSCYVEPLAQACLPVAEAS